MFPPKVYYKEAVGAMVVFDVTRVSTFEAVEKWKNDIDAKVRHAFTALESIYAGGRR